MATFNIFTSPFSKDISSYNIDCASCVYGCFNLITGRLIGSNGTFKTLIKKASLQTIISPSIEKIIEENEKSGSFKGIITIGDYDSLNHSLNGKIFIKDDLMLVLGNIDVLNLLEQSERVNKLNNEVNSLQRRLIKEKHQVEVALRKYKEINEEKNKLLGMAAHDIRNPISTVMSFVDLMQSDYKQLSPEQIERFLGVIYERCNFSIKLLNDILNYSKIESGKLSLELSEFDIVSFSNSIVRLASELANKKKQTISFSSNKESFVVIADMRRLEQVLQNLLSNAIKFSHEGNEITVSLNANDDGVVLNVVDYGVGIEPSELEHIFTPFQKISSKPTSGEKSAGLGLAIVKKIVEEHHGQVHVSSQLNKGSTFGFKLPIN